MTIFNVIRVGSVIKNVNKLAASQIEVDFCVLNIRNN